ncbi:MAG: hypothetical protein M3217_00290 [Actinomycetota bacterium]|nr:hypothetical protein [Actinomycetota bacterium]
MPVNQAANLYEDLRTALQQFDTFVGTEPNRTALKNAYGALAQLFPQLGPAVIDLEALLGRVREEINNLNLGAVPGLTQVTTLAQSVSTLLDSAKALVPEEEAAIDDINEALSVVGGLSGVTDQVKADIIAAIDSVLGHLAFIRS